MTIEAHIAVQEALAFECKLDAIRRNQDGTIKLTVTVHNHDFPAVLMKDDMGQRYQAVLVAKNDDETPKVRAPGLPTGEDAPPEGSSPASSAAPSKRWDELSSSQRAGMLCSDHQFFYWITMHYVWEQEPEDTETESCAKWLRQQCGVASRRDIQNCPEARKAFDELYTSFDTWRKYGDR